MVFYFRSRDGEFLIYMGKDKYENEDLIKYGHPEDVWFHVDDLSSAHVYLRMKPDMAMDDIPEDVLLDCSALVKANSIQGCKKSFVYVVYTRWKNLKKTNSMVDGQVGFHRPENVRRCKVEKNNPIVKAIEKTREERHPDLAAEQDARLRKIQQQKKQHHKELLRKKEKERREAEAAKEAKSYDRIFTDDKMVSNSEKNATVDATAAEEYEDDFF